MVSREFRKVVYRGLYRGFMSGIIYRGMIYEVIHVCGYKLYRGLNSGTRTEGYVRSMIGIHSNIPF